MPFPFPAPPLREQRVIVRIKDKKMGPECNSQKGEKQTYSKQKANEEPA